MKLSNVGSSKFRRLRYGGLQWWFQILSSAGPFMDGKIVSIHPSAFDYAMEDQSGSKLFLGRVQESSWMKLLLVHPKHVCLGYGGQYGFKVCSL
jgi:hypothetical protein